MDAPRTRVPVPGTIRERLIRQAELSFGAGGFDSIGVHDLAAAAGVTTGSVYHHFDSKLGLYAIVRDDIEKRVCDRVEGAMGVEPGTGSLSTALLVGFDWLVRTDRAVIIGEPHPDPLQNTSPLDDLVVKLADTDSTGAVRGLLVLSAWRTALRLAVSRHEGVRHVRRALAELLVRCD